MDVSKTMKGAVEHAPLLGLSHSGVLPAHTREPGPMRLSPMPYGSAQLHLALGWLKTKIRSAAAMSVSRVLHS